MSKEYRTFSDGLLQEILSYTQLEGTCLKWQGGKNQRGYGQLRVDRRKTLVTHLVWKLLRGDIPQGLYILHTCDNPPCINIGHLFLGTKWDNQLDAITKGRMNHPKGEEHGNTSLTNENVKVIKILMSAYPRRAPKGFIQKVAKIFNVSTQVIQRIRQGITWKDD